MHDVNIQELKVEVSKPKIDTIVIPQAVIQQNSSQKQQTLNDEPTVVEPQVIALRRSQRGRRSTISNDYVVYLQESKFDF